MLSQEITSNFIGRSRELEIFTQWLTDADAPWIDEIRINNWRKTRRVRDQIRLLVAVRLGLSRWKGHHLRAK